MKKKKPSKSVTSGDSSPALSPLGVLLLHSTCGLGLAAGFWVPRSLYSVNFISDPARTLLSAWVIECPIVILLFSIFRQKPSECSYLKAVGRGVLGLPIGALMMALGAITLGAPVSTKQLLATINWSLLMSLFTVTPAACVLGSSWSVWTRLFAATSSRKLVYCISLGLLSASLGLRVLSAITFLSLEIGVWPTESLEYVLCLPAHGAVIGSWFGAWPMPLDWERPWQEWPICVAYGGIAGYVLGMIASFGLVLFGRKQRLKGE